MDSLFVTGAGGFLGSALIDRLARGGHRCFALDRREDSGSRRSHGVSGSVRWLRADLFDSAAYREALAGSKTVIHLAAATGNVSRQEHFKVNAEGTRLLLDGCREAGVERFLFVSSIAVKFPDKSRYYYAQAKTVAEDHVRSSELPFLIVRPTIIVGRGAPVLTGLSKLACLPVIPVFGDGRTPVQPIYVEDLVDFILAALEAEVFDGQTLEFGGPDSLPIERFLQQIRLTIKGRSAATVHLPLRLVLPCLAAAEAIAYRFVPVTVGQLSTFRFAGTIESNPLYEERRRSLRSVPQMLEASLSA